MAIVSDKVDFKAKQIAENREGDCIMINRSIYQKETVILKVYVPDNRASKYMRQKVIELKRGIDKATIIAGNVNTLLSATDRTTSEKITKDIEELNNAVNQQDLVNMY